MTEPNGRNVGAVMSHRKRKKSKSAGNIKAEAAYDPFPKYGLVKQYEPFIRKEVGEFCKRYPQLGRGDVLFEAIRLALTAVKAFNPKLGYDFSTLLRHHLKGLHRFAEREAKLHSMPLSATLSEEENERRRLAAEQEAEEAKTPAPEFPGGANGARVTLDFQFMESDAAEKRRRTVVGVQLGSFDVDRVRSVWDRASADVRLLLGYDLDESRKQAFVRAALDHHERCRDEIEQETFLEARSRTGGIDIKHYKGRKPSRFEPDRIPIVSLEDAYRHDDDWVGKLSDTIAAGYAQESPDSKLIDAINAERPFLSRHQGATADWMLGLLSGTDRRSLVQFADDQGVSKGYASKLRDQVAKRIGQRFKK